MKNVLFGLGLVSFAWLAACSAFNDASSTTGESLVRCNSNADCMTGLECEIEHSATSGVCAVHGVKGAGGGANEHGTGGADDRDGAERAAGGTDDHGTDDTEHGAGGADDHDGDRAADDHGVDGTEHGAGGADDHDGDRAADDHGAETGSGGSVSASSCATNADCATGFECEIETEHGVTIGTCRAHGGGKGK